MTRAADDAPRGRPCRVRQMPYPTGDTWISGPRSPGRCPGSRTTSTPSGPGSRGSRGTDPRRRRRDLVTGLRQSLAVDLDLADESRVQEVQGDGIRQAPGHGLVAHRIDLELERLAGTLSGADRIAHIGRFVVGDRHPFAAQHPQRGADDVRRGRRRIGVGAPGRRGRGVAGVRHGLDIDPVPPPGTRSPPSWKLNSRST